MKRKLGFRTRGKRDLERYEEDYRDDYYEDDIENLDDEDFGDEDYYEDDDYREDEEYYEDEDYPEEDNYQKKEVEEVYEDEDYPEEDRFEDDEYSEDDYEDESYEEEDFGEEDYNEEDLDEEGYSDEDYRDEDFDEEYDEEYDGEYDEEDYDEYEDEYADRGRSRRGRDRGVDRDRDRGRGRDRYRDEDDEDSFPAKVVAIIANSTAIERVAAIFAIFLIVGGIFTAAFYSKVLNNKAQIDSFAEVGSTISDEIVVGESGLIAVADAERAKAMAAQLVIEDEEYTEEEEVEEEVADDAEDVTIKMTLTSIKSDMKVKFINSKTGKLVANLPLEIDVVTPDGSTVTYNDHDQDGIIYKKDITAGEYKITPRSLPSGYDNYKLELKTKTLTVKDKVEMKAVDVSNEVKKESQVNAAKEDTAVKTEVESKLEDTVEWVESTKTPIGESSDGTYTYEEVNKDTIVRPDSASMVGTRKWMLLGLARSNSNTESASGSSSEEGAGAGSSEGSGTGSSSEAGDGSSKETETPKEKDKLKFSDYNSTMTEGEEQTVSVSGTNADVSLSSSDNSVVSVSGKTLKAEKEGTATITASGDNCESAEITITVKAKEKEKADFSVNGNTITVKVGESKSIGASATSTITYKSEDESIATVNGSGEVKGVKEGSTKITLTADGYKDGTVNVTVAKADDKTMSGVPASVSMKVGDEYKLNVTGPSSIKYETSESKVATVDNGTIKAIAEGKAKITLTADGYAKAEFEVTVAKADAKEMKIESKSLTVKVAENVQIKVTEPAKVTYKSADENIATVAADGKVTGKSVGKTTITVTPDASAGNYSSATVNIEVVANSGKSDLIKISKITIVEGQSIKLSPADSSVSMKLVSENTNIVTISDNTTINGKSAGEVKVTASADGYISANISVKVVGKDTVLKDKNGNEIYILRQDGVYDKATYEDYYKRDKFFLKKAATNYKYTGWQTIGGKTYFYDKNGNVVTGEQVIQGAKYTFGSDGALSTGNGVMGIDVSKWNGNIDWTAVKNSGINFVIIRCGYRGSSQGQLIEDPKFRANIKGAQAAGIKVGVYFFTQAVNEVEAVEEASMVINLIQGYNISYPVYLDVEASHGRGDQINAAQRTANIKAFCGTIQNAGYKAGVYANKTWFTSYINTSQITNYRIWLAQYASAVTYNSSRYDMWQYTSKGRVTGISGNVDMNICY